MDYEAEARKNPEAKVPELAVALASELLTQAQREETRAEDEQRASLRTLLSAPQSQQLALALTDRLYRSPAQEQTVAAAIEAIRTIGIAPSLPSFDRVQLRALVALGASVPGPSYAALRARIRGEAEPFVLSARPGEFTPRLQALRRSGAATNLNYLGEEVLGESEAQRRLSTYADLLGWPDIDALSIKLSAIDSQLDVLAWHRSVGTCLERMEPLLERAAQGGTLVYFDMEAYRDLEITCAVVRHLALSKRYLQVELGMAIQAYVPDSLSVVERLLEVSRKRVALGGAPLRLRIVKGANLAMEQVEASAHRLPCPVFPSKAAVDAHYKRILHRLLQPDAEGVLRVGVASHNLFDLSYAMLLASHRGVSSLLSLEMLAGMAGATARVLAGLGQTVLLYTPAVTPAHFPAAISYLVRRLDENTGPENFLRNASSMQAGDENFQKEARRFLQATEDAATKTVGSFRQQDRSAPPPLTRRNLQTGRFDNAPDTDWTRAANRTALHEALSQAHDSSCEIQLRIAGRDCNGEAHSGVDPSRPGHAAYTVHLANSQQVEDALQAGQRAEALWGKTPPHIRALALDRAADELERDRLRLIAALVLDGGKSAREADGEVSEVVDFARYYARSLVELERDYILHPRGLTVITPPWNFPLAIPLGGAFAALAAGNPVILKPAHQTPLIARLGCEACWRAGIPGDALQFLPTQEGTASPLIVDRRVQAVVLTGATSTARKFLQMRPDLHLLAETGGKNGAYLSALSDHEAALKDCLFSAFGHAGQKCSALSVLVVQEELYGQDSFKDLLVDAARSLPTGSAWDLHSVVTPLVEVPSGPLERALRLPPDHASWALRPVQSRDNPRLLSPGVLWGAKVGDFVQQTELFGPVLAVMSARNIYEGMTFLNSTEYGLTAGFFGLSEREQETFLRLADAGNLYINRPITGAIVGRQPFGGRKDSGFGPGAKAGGPSYLLALSHPEARDSSFSVPEEFVSAAEERRKELFPSHAGTPATGERNVLRYELRPDLRIVRFPDALEAEVDAVCSAARFVGAPGEALDGHPHGDKGGVTALMRLLQDRGVRRLRCIGTPSEKFLLKAAAASITLCTDAVSHDLKLEARHFTREQSVSLSYHRHGNTSLEPAPID